MSNISGKLAPVAVRVERAGRSVPASSGALPFARVACAGAESAADEAGAATAGPCPDFLRRRRPYISIQAANAWGWRTVSIRLNRYRPMAVATKLAAQIPAAGETFPCRAQ